MVQSKQKELVSGYSFPPSFKIPQRILIFDLKNYQLDFLYCTPPSDSLSGRKTISISACHSAEWLLALSSQSKEPKASSFVPLLLKGTLFRN